MFLDSGTIISDETFYTQSQIVVEKIPVTKAERFCRKFGNFFHHYLTVCRMFRQ